MVLKKEVTDLGIRVQKGKDLYSGSLSSIKRAHFRDELPEFKDETVRSLLEKGEGVNGRFLLGSLDCQITLVYRGVDCLPYGDYQMMFA